MPLKVRECSGRSSLRELQALEHRRKLYIKMEKEKPRKKIKNILREKPRSSPIVILSQRHLLKVNVYSLALGGLQQPVAGQVVAVVTGKTGGDDPTDCDVPDQTAAGG